MNTLRIILIGLALTNISTGIKGQNTATSSTDEKRVSWQARATLGSATILMPSADFRFSYAIGGGANIRLSKNGVWRVQPGLQIVQKGMTFDGFYGNEQIMAANFGTRLHYLEMPVPFAVRLRIGRGNFITFKVGPYFAYGLSGKTTVKVNDTDHKETFAENHFAEPCSFHGAAEDSRKKPLDFPKFKRWDVGITKGVELTFGHAIIGANLSFGLNSIAHDIFMGNTADQIFSAIFLGGKPRNLTAGLTFGYQF